jgi:tetratricopeptide (TPR) repeat protein
MVLFWKNAKELNDKAFSLADQGKYSEAREIFQKADDKASEEQDELLKLYAFYGMTLCDVQMADEIPILFLLKNRCSMVEEKLNGMEEIAFFIETECPTVDVTIKSQFRN